MSREKLNTTQRALRILKALKGRSLTGLDVKIEVPKAHNARAKGQVEKGNDIVERQFESGLRFMNVSGLAELNQLAHRWMRYFNGKAIHSRHKLTRYQMWQFNNLFWKSISLHFTATASNGRSIVTNCHSTNNLVTGDLLERCKSSKNSASSAGVIAG